MLGRHTERRLSVSVSAPQVWAAGDPSHGALAIHTPARWAATGVLRGSKRAETILHLVPARPDITIQELRHELSGMDLAFGYGTILRFPIRHDMTRKKKLGMLPNRTEPMS